MKVSSRAHYGLRAMTELAKAYGGGPLALSEIARVEALPGTYLEQLMGELSKHLDPEYVTPLVAYLCSEQCELTHEIFDVGAGRYARIFVGMGKGWLAPKGVHPTPEMIAANLGTIRETEGYTIPDSIAGEMGAVAAALKARG